MSSSPSPNDPAHRSAHSPLSPTGWAAQAHRDLVQAEAELRRLQERQATEADSVRQGLERAMLGVRREERRLLERVEQDHRDTQQHLEQVHKENVAAARVSQALLDQRLGNLVLLQHRIQEAAKQTLVDQSFSNQTLLLKEVAEFLQPWEVSVSLKKVTFKPSSQPNAVTFGDIRAQGQSFSLHTGGCGPRGQVCALHSQEIPCRETSHQVAEEDRSPLEQGWTTTPGTVVEKMSLSSLHDPESKEESMTSLSKSKKSRLKSHQDQKMESVSCLKKVPTILSPDCREDEWSMGSRNQRKPPTVSSSSSFDCSREIQRGAARKGTQGCSLLRPGKGSLSSPGRSRNELSASHSCLDLTSLSSSRGHPHSRLSQSSDEHSLGTVCDSGRATSPADSLDSSYTFVLSRSQDYSINRNSLSNDCRLSKSAVDLPYMTRPLIGPGTKEYIGAWSQNCENFVRPASPPPSRGLGVSVRRQLVSYQDPNQPAQPLMARSVSMSILDVSSHEPKRGRGGRGGPLALVEVQEEGEPRESRLIRQFGKQGSGRTDFTLPSGLHCTPQGQVFIVDCGNARVQVTDPQGNVLQQVTSPNSDGFARRCRNFFDIAVNTKGLVALSCAAERTLLVFNRHGRLLQTFGGSTSGPTKDELEAPRGVTVTRLDEFLVADIRMGTLVALKLDHKTGSRLERTVVTGFHRPYLVAACVSSGMVAVSERGTETGRVPCIKVLEPGWNTVRVLGVCSAMGPILVCPWGLCIDAEGDVLVADWGDAHRILMFPSQGAGRSLVSRGLRSPRGIGLLPRGHLVVSDSMNHCVKIYQYKSEHV
ncbi:uncharacterized protein LOC133486721 [Phyllopteryx taeniolatus]|uniref:uncharacterized protein LOC133486721 n=1 Tax=Phyllopteryx taeniolatus TaxID=161469 RepID=UPI002AD510C9|nr:uncharacterized protein LOC133486721 [Phyllopteryx taeniolatus]